ncbi:Glycine--tRNA ligase, mitochondrial 1 [Aduncisulcus paluster]|uniref:glycine--tRNA ligase n=1 Tax=Aduncisulcus paluster TaxID=2918883 RepID=A0ABQ5KXV0_9EUKA|nr:Glycine--tRNA ligase, mitochondrial 1 [Aduncisulcus paluster]
MEKKIDRALVADCLKRRFFVIPSFEIYGGMAGLEGMEKKIDRALVADCLKRRFFVIPSFEIYGGMAGLFDLGPPGCALKRNILDVWHQHFVIHDSMQEIDASCLTPKVVLKASGHVDKFTDLMVRDVKTKLGYRADQLLEDSIDKMLQDPEMAEERKKELTHIRARAEDFTPKELHEQIQTLGIKSEYGNELSEPYPYNLMFGTQIGPSGDSQGYLRPETAQGIFVNFKRCLAFNGGQLPFGVAQVGQAFRNEISPRSGLLRVREFTLAEIEHFMDHGEGKHPGFDAIKDVKCVFYPAVNKLGDKKTQECTVGEAVERGYLGHETHAYFVARTQMFLERIGFERHMIRFEQHLPTQLAHYAADCWDAMIYCSYGWTECVGIADRSAFDLECHTRGSGENLKARVVYDKPIIEEKLVPKLVKGVIGRTFRREAGNVCQAIEGLDQDGLKAMMAKHAEKENSEVTDADGKTFEVTPAMVTISKKTIKTSGHTFTPRVCEPSFGIGRILYCLLEQSFYVREGDDEQRAVFKFKPEIASVKCAILPIYASAEFNPILDDLVRTLSRARISNKLDRSGSTIGKRYSRLDEIGVPFIITVDFDTLKDNTVTIRERDSMNQVRLPIADIVGVVSDLSIGEITFDSVVEKYGLFK